MDTSFKGRAKKLEDADIARGALMLKSGEDELHAVVEVEGAGRAYDAKGRPIMLFEPHVFYRNLPKDKRRTAVKNGIAYAKWGHKPYPKDSYPRLIAAMKLDETAALKSASWGMGQILGENHKAAGYTTVQDMVQAMMDDEANQLFAMIKFIIANKLDNALRRHDWHAFARGYNGPGYAKHGYHTRLAKAYAKWAKIKDTPFSEAELEKGIEQAMKEVVQPVNGQPDDPGVDNKEEPKKQSKPLSLGVGAIVATIFMFFWNYISNLPCNVLGIFCGG